MGEETTILDIAGKTDDGIIVNLRDGTQAIISDSEEDVGNLPTVTLNDSKTDFLIQLASNYRTSLTMNTFIENARTAEDFESYTRDFNAAYMQGIQGKRFNTARFTITDEQARAAYVAGRGDADALIDSSPTDMTFVEWKKSQKMFTNTEKDDIIDIDIDEFVPCLKDAKTGEILETEVSEMSRNDLKGYNISSGWNVTWTRRPSDESIFGVFLKGDSKPQGLISLVYEKGATYIAIASTAPHNNKLLVGKNQKYIGVGGHLFALAVEQSARHGGGGAVYGFAVNERVLKHYIENFGADRLITHRHEYQFIIEGEAAQKLLDTYNYERR